MSNILNLKGVKFFAIIVLAVAILATFGMVATTASAQQADVSVSDIQYAATVKQSSSVSQAAVIWQKFLNRYSSANLVQDGRFGPLSVAAAKVWQASRNLSADGVLGAMSRASAVTQINGGVTNPIGGNYPAGCSSASGFSVTTGLSCAGGSNLPAGCTSTAGYSPTTGASCSGGGTPSGPLSGGAGDITLTLRGSYSGEEVGEGEEDVKVLAVDVEADDDSDVELDSVKVEFFQATAADDRDLPDYASEVSVWLKGVKVGSADTSDFTESSNYFSKSISLNNAVVRAGDEDELVIAVSANSSLDSGDINSDAWQVDILSVRFTDADGVTTTESGSATATAGAGTYGKLFDFASFATANDAELTLTLEDEAINDIHLLDSDDSSDTDQAITSVLFDASGDSDIWVDEVVATITTTGDISENNLVVNTWIEVDGVRISEKETVADGGAVTYDDLDRTISGGDAEEFVFWVTMQDVDGALDDADTVQLTVTTASTVAEDEAGDTVTAAGSNAVGGVHPLYNNGIRLTGFSSTATSSVGGDNANDGSVELTLNFDVFNYGDTTLYIPDGDTLTGTPSTSATTTAPSTSEKVGYHIQSGGTVTPGSNDISAILSESDTDLVQKTNSFELASGKTGTFSLKVTVATDGTPSIDNVDFRALLAGLGWATSDTATSAVVYTANLTDYKTGYVKLND